MPGIPVDFSHGDVDAVAPFLRALEAFGDGYKEGGKQAYTEYRGRSDIRLGLADKLAYFSGVPVDYQHELIVAPGTQGALFLASNIFWPPTIRVVLFVKKMLCWKVVGELNSDFLTTPSKRQFSV